VSTVTEVRGGLEAAEVAQLHAYWRATNYLSVGQIYLLDNAAA
jgi:xylulose-5-phosphate/fructose-6-phosphate phosphoketolase